jgi:hypothetical protein
VDYTLEIFPCPRGGKYELMLFRGKMWEGEEKEERNVKEKQEKTNDQGN